MNRADIIDLIRENVTALSPEEDSSNTPEIRVVGSISRPTSAIWFADIAFGERLVPIVVKCGTMVAATPHQRLPRLTPAVPAPQMITRQSQALGEIDHQFALVNDPRFTAVEVLLHDAERRVLIMSRLPGDEMLSRLHSAARPFSFRAYRDLSLYSRMAGEWLKIFHTRVDLSPGVQVFTRNSQLRDQAVAWLNSVSPEETPWRKQLTDNIEKWLKQLPSLRRSVLHGDYWPGNVMVHSQQIGIIDVLGWAEGPVWLDIAYFLFHLRATDLQVWLQNSTWSNRALRKAEQEFLNGYFGSETIEPSAVYLFQTLAVLAKWARSAESLRETTGIRYVKKRLLFSWRSRYYRSLIASWLD